VDRAQEVMATRGRLRGLWRATQLIGADLALPVVLRHVADAARDLIGARYAALGVIAADGHLAEFIHTGMDADTVARIGHLPQGKGLLGALIDDATPIRLAMMRADDRSGGVPSAAPSPSPPRTQEAPTCAGRSRSENRPTRIRSDRARASGDEGRSLTRPERARAPEGCLRSRLRNHHGATTTATRPVRGAVVGSAWGNAVPSGGQRRADTDSSHHPGHVDGLRDGAAVRRKTDDAGRSSRR
jgi:hypothetical protein